MMAVRIGILLAVCAVLDLVFVVPRGSGEWRGDDGLFFGSEDGKVMDLSELWMKHVWSNCMLDLLGKESVISASDLIIINGILYHSTEDLWEDIQQILPHLTPDMKRSLIYCLIKQSLLHSSRDIKQDSFSRRHLEAQPVRKASLSSDLSPAPTLTPSRQIQTLSTAPAPILARRPALIPDIGLNRQALVPSLPPSELPLPENDPEDFAQSSSPGNFLQPEVVHIIPHISAAPMKQRSQSVQTIIIAVVVTAAATFTLAAFCFCCCNRYAGSKYQTVHGQKDERPILSLSLSDFSGSSQNSFDLYKAKFGSSFKTDPNQSGQLTSFASSAERHSISSSSDELANAPHNRTPPTPPPPPPLKLPSGKASASPPAPPPPLAKPKPAPTPPKGPQAPKANSGNELPIELLQTLLRMAPTSDEELKLRLFNDDSVFLGPAEQFLKAIVNIPSAFKRIDALLFMTLLQEESSSVRESFATLEVC